MCYCLLQDLRESFSCITKVGKSHFHVIVYIKTIVGSRGKTDEKAQKYRKHFHLKKIPMPQQMYRQC